MLLSLFREQNPNPHGVLSQNPWIQEVECVLHLNHYHIALERIKEDELSFLCINKTINYETIIIDIDF